MKPPVTKKMYPLKELINQKYHWLALCVYQLRVDLYTVCVRVDVLCLRGDPPQTREKNRLAMATFWHAFHHDGKFSQVWCGWGGGGGSPFTRYTITSKVVVSCVYVTKYFSRTKNKKKAELSYYNTDVFFFIDIKIQLGCRSRACDRVTLKYRVGKQLWVILYSFLINKLT